MQLVHDGSGDPVVFGRPPGTTVRIGVPAPEPVRAVVVADVLRRILEDRYELQVFTTVVRPGEEPEGHEWAVLDHVLRALWIPPPTHFADSFPDRPVNVVVEPEGHHGAVPEGVLRVRVGPVRIADRVLAGAPDFLPLRLALLNTPLRAPVPVGRAELDRAESTVERWRNRVASWAGNASARMPQEVVTEAYAALDDDVDVPGVLTVLERLEADPSIADGAKFEVFVHLDRFLGLDLPRYLGSGH
ncbi:hypothetical protein GCM10022222_59360 [Amycolatopsis ultiminotia]|uniref:Uncharacterized protein n=1 Tax=Amycolatopsis ultiminotia TaxID=543629 RepID=A0ABP6XJ07_9PSEU